MKQGVWRGMPYFDAFWRKRHLTRREMQKIFTSYYAYVFLVMVITVAVLLDIHGFAARVSVTALVTYTVSLTFLTFALYFYATDIGLKLSEKFNWFFMIYPLVGFAAITVATVVVELGMSSTFGGQLSLERAPEKWPVNLVLALVMETLFITFVVPTVLNSNLSEENQDKPIEDAASISINIAGISFAYEQLISVSAQDHYVRIRTKEGEQMIRARLSDIITQFPPQNSIQPHRSHWVSREAADSVESNDGHKTLKLTDGSSVPIARGRLRDVQAWLES